MKRLILTASVLALLAPALPALADQVLVDPAQADNASQLTRQQAEHAAEAQDRNDALKKKQQDNAQALRDLRQQSQENSLKGEEQRLGTPVRPQFGVQRKSPSALDRLKKKQGTMFYQNSLSN